MLVFINSETGKPFDDCYQEYLAQIYHCNAPNPKTEGEIVCTFEPKEEPIEVGTKEWQSLTIGQRLRELKENKRLGNKK